MKRSLALKDSGPVHGTFEDEQAQLVYDRQSNFGFQVLNFEQGRLQGILWKNDNCKSCQGNSTFVCVRGECAIPSANCREAGGREDCSLSIQLTWSGTDRRQQVLNSWYQISNLNQYSLYGLYSNLKSTLSNQYNSIMGTGRWRTWTIHQPWGHLWHLWHPGGSAKQIRGYACLSILES